MTRSDPELFQLIKKHALKKFKKGEPILNPDQKLEYVYYVNTGLVKMYSVSINGQAVTLNYHKPDSYFPMIWALPDKNNQYYYSAHTNAEVYQVPIAKVVEFLKKHPDSLMKLTIRAFSGINGLITRVESLALGKSHQKVASILLIMQARFGKTHQNRTKIDILLTHQDIADLTGLTRETVSLIMSEFRSQDLINYQAKKVTIINPDQLRLLL